MLSSVAKNHLVTALFEFFKKRDLLDDIRLRRDQNQMDIGTWPSCDGINETFAGKRDVIHETNRV